MKEKEVGIFWAGKKKGSDLTITDKKKISNFSSMKKFSIFRLSEKIFWKKKLLKKRIIFIVSSDFFFYVSLGEGHL